LYRQCGPKERRLLNQAIFEKLYLDAHDVVDGILAEPFAELLGAQRHVERHGYATAQFGSDHPLFETRAGLLVTALSDGGWNKTAMAEVMVT
jgi:hypothetical protein